MQRRQFIRHALRWGAAGAAVWCIPGCGTFLHSERRGQPHSDHIDWKIVALDSLGLLLFFIPGVVAFAVDFSTGAIYLPMEPSYPGYGANPQQLPNTAPQSQPWPSPQPADAASATPKHCQPTWQECGLKRVAIPREELQRQRIEQVVTHHVGQPVSLDNRQARLSVLPCIERFDEQAGRHRSNHNFGVAVRSFFARLKLA